MTELHIACLNVLLPVTEQSKKKKKLKCEISLHPYKNKINWEQYLPVDSNTKHSENAYFTLASCGSWSGHLMRSCLLASFPQGALKSNSVQSTQIIFSYVALLFLLFILHLIDSGKRVVPRLTRSRTDSPFWICTYPAGRCLFGLLVISPRQPPRSPLLKWCCIYLLGWNALVTQLLFNMNFLTDK